MIGIIIIFAIMLFDIDFSTVMFCLQNYPVVAKILLSVVVFLFNVAVIIYIIINYEK